MIDPKKTVLGHKPYQPPEKQPETPPAAASKPEQAAEQAAPRATEPVEPSAPPAHEPTPPTAPDHDLLDSELQAVSSGKASLAVAIVAVLGCLGLGYYAWSLRGAGQEKDGQIKAAEAKEKELAADLEKTGAERTEARTELEAVKKELEGLKKEQTVLKDKLERSSVELKGTEELVEELEAFEKEFKKLITAKRLEVDFRDGRMMLRLSTSALFSSGSAELSKQGKKTLEEIAGFLKEGGKRRFSVTGHTDNAPADGDEQKSNWQLSAARAATVTETLIASEVAAGVLRAVGLADTDPIAKNTTIAGRKKNRRIEIVVEPEIVEPSKPTKKKKKRRKRRRRR